MSDDNVANADDADEPAHEADDDGAPAAPPSDRPSTVHHAVHEPHNRKELALLSLGALGVVYGDIGTSPLYAVKECLTGEHGMLPKNGDAVEYAYNVYGVMSLILWALLLVVVVKYLTFIMRADNKGEGGILALAALVAKNDGKRPVRLGVPILLALFGAGLLYGDGVITPAISVLGAVEGLGEQSPAFNELIVPITVAILIGLFMVQRYGTGRIGGVFGWVMIAVLAVTGGEALYADMGHFGKKPIRWAWYCVAFPGLLFNYFGQGAHLLSEPVGSVSNPFFSLVEGPMLIPMVILATMAAIIASQALISGAFSLTHQAVQLGYCPRVTVVHTSHKTEGQIYIPEVNYVIMVACVALVLAYRSSTSLAAAYGIAVTGTMAITSYLYFLVCRQKWGYSLPGALALFIPFIFIDLGFFSANAIKVVEGGWIPLSIGAGIFIVFTTWWRGRSELSKIMDTGTMPDDLFLMDIAANPLPRVPGTAVFMASSREGIPNVVLHHVKHNKVLHQQVVLLSVQTENVPWVQGSKSIEVRNLNDGFFRVTAHVGFMQTPDVPKFLARCAAYGVTWREADTTYYMGRQTLLVTGSAPLARWRKILFSFLTRNSRAPTAFFQLPPNRVVELGLQIEL
ncbi:MAG: KUP/HAK/KT family potassium transporter [Deltaproteobacteria bacterium]|nr:KUP/HAK/KT family potassium transporter [Deltaproteobacteria bacterium]